MSDGEREKFIRQAIAPMAANAELEQLARARLVERMEGNPEPAEYPELRGKRSWKWLLWLLALGAFVAALWRPVEEVMFFKKAASHWKGFYFLDQELLADMFSGEMSEEERLLVFGDTTQDNPEDRWRPLRELLPDDPVVLAAYARVVAEENDGIPDELWLEAERIDPTNGIYHIIAAVQAFEDSAEHRRANRRDRKKGKTDRWEILDADRLQVAMDHLRAAAEFDVIARDGMELAAARREALPPAKDWLGIVRRNTVNVWSESGLPRRRNIGRALQAEAWRLGQADDREGLRELMVLHRRLSLKLVESSSSLVGLLTILNLASGPYDEFLGAAQKVGLDEETIAELEHRRDRLKSFRERKQAQESDERVRRYLWERGSFFAPSGGSVGLASQQRLIPDRHLLPGRRADHAFWTRVLFFALAALFGLVAGSVAWAGRMTNQLDRSLAKSVGRGWRVVDGVWVALGLLLPLVWLGVVRYATPWGGLDWSVGVSGLAVGASQVGCLAVMMLGAMLAASRWRKAKRFGVLGGVKPNVPGPLFAALFAGVAVPLIGAWSPDDGWVSWYRFGWLLGGVGLFLLMRAGTRPSLGGRVTPLDRLLVSQLYLAGLAGGVLVASLLTWALYQEERHWVRLDPFSGGAEGGLGFLAYEEKVVAQGRKELLELLTEDAGIGP